MVYANEYGFLPNGDPEENARALQTAVDLGGEILVEAPGVYPLSEPILLGDDTTLRFAEGTSVRREPSKSGKNGNAFRNRGAFTREWNKNIAIIGLTMDCNGVESSFIRAGWRAQLGFMCMEGLTIRDLTLTGLLAKDYGVQLSSFRNVLIEDILITGNKDGVHFGPGRGFILRRAKFCTFDDPIALNAYDYSTSSAEIGMIEDGLIEDCYDLPAEKTTGYFCRLCTGMWVDWHDGMEVAHSDTVVSEGRIYRLVTDDPRSGKFFPSHCRPTHTSGLCEYPDGLRWAMTQEGAIYNCACRNITFRRCHLQKDRHNAIACEWFVGTYARSYAPGGTAIPHKGIVLEDISVEAEVKNFFLANAPIADLTVKGVSLGGARLVFAGYTEYGDRKYTDLVYPETRLILADDSVPRDRIAVVSPARLKIVAE